jgi:hypothetical protein
VRLQKSCSVLRVMGPTVNGSESYVTGDRIHCIYRADTEDSIHRTRLVVSPRIASRRFVVPSIPAPPSSHDRPTCPPFRSKSTRR